MTEEEKKKQTRTFIILGVIVAIGAAAIAWVYFKAKKS